MKDIFETTILCDDCNQKTEKIISNKEGYRIRAWRCNSCQKVWSHPADMEEYGNFQKLHNKQFQVKLRVVGNSYTISIPREIIEFEEELRREMNSMIRLSLDSPEKISIYFSGQLKRFMKDDFAR